MSSQFTILLVEDNYEHLRLTSYILREQGIAGEVVIARDGQEAVNYLFRRDRFSDPITSPRPHLVLLDLNIPRIDGKELLRIMKNDTSLCEIPVVVMSSSDREEDILFAEQQGAAAYISKADGFDRLSQALSALRRFEGKGHDAAAPSETNLP
jgi:CheY-like chemotaxis protein